MDEPVWEFDAPVETDRLILRPHRLTDLEDLLVFHSDPEVVRYLPWPIRGRSETFEHLRGRVGMTRAASDGEWLVLAAEERATSSVIGEVLLKREDGAAGIAELGFAFARRVHGLGLAREATEALLAAGIPRFGLRRLLAVTDERNHASRRLLERLGFASEGAAADSLERFVRAAG